MKPLLSRSDAVRGRGSRAADARVSRLPDKPGTRAAHSWYQRRKPVTAGTCPAPMIKPDNYSKNTIPTCQWNRVHSVKTSLHLLATNILSPKEPAPRCYQGQIHLTLPQVHCVTSSVTVTVSRFASSKREINSIICLKLKGLTYMFQYVSKNIIQQITQSSKQLSPLDNPTERWITKILWHMGYEKIEKKSEYVQKDKITWAQINKDVANHPWLYGI